MRVAGYIFHANVAITSTRRDPEFSFTALILPYLNRVPLHGAACVPKNLAELSFI